MTDFLAFTIVGIAPATFFGPEVGRTFDIVLPLGDEPLVKGRETWLDGRSTWWLSVMARLKPGQSADTATQTIRTLQPEIRDATAPGWEGYLKDPFTLLPAASGESALRRRYERPLVIIMINRPQGLIPNRRRARELTDRKLEAEEAAADV